MSRIQKEGRYEFLGGVPRGFWRLGQMSRKASRIVDIKHFNVEDQVQGPRWSTVEIEAHIASASTRLTQFRRLIKWREQVT